MTKNNLKARKIFREKEKLYKEIENSNRKRALKIINNWCETAHKLSKSSKSKEMLEHKKQFWIARDIIEGHILVPENLCEIAINWIETKTKESDDRTLLLIELKKIFPLGEYLPKKSEKDQKTLKITQLNFPYMGQ